MVKDATELSSQASVGLLGLGALGESPLAIDAWGRLRAQGRGANDVTDAVFFSAEQARRDLGRRPVPTDRAPADAGGPPRR